MKSAIVLIIASALLIFSCNSYELKDPERYDYVTSGALSDDCFQVIITIQPEKEYKTMADQRENAFIKAKDSIITETVKQILSYYSSSKSLKSDLISPEKLNTLKEKAGAYSKLGTIDQEYYLIDNSAVLVYRIFKKGIKNEILNI